MVEDSLSCPSCRASKYSNPHLKLMVNVCGHSLCENCVEVLFVRGSGLCVQCKTPIRKNNFRYQLFEDPLVQKEVEIRKKVLSDFNKREDDFNTMEEYDLYLEMVEELIFNLTNGIDVDETKRYIEVYKKENKDIIKKNRLRPSASLAFYEAELEHEALLREQREREELEELSEMKRSRFERQARMLQDIIPTDVDVPNCTDSANSEQASRRNAVHPTNTVPTPASSFMPQTSDPIRSRQFVAPATAQTAGLTPLSSRSRSSADRRLLPPPPSTAGFMIPPSMLPVAPPSAGGGVMNSIWATGIHHHRVHIPTPTPVLRKQEDTVVLSRPHQLPTNKSTSNALLDSSKDMGFVYEPYRVELCGPLPPISNEFVRWPDILSVYELAVIAPLTAQSLTSTKQSPTSGSNDIAEKPPASRLSSEVGRGIKVEGNGKDSRSLCKTEGTDESTDQKLFSEVQDAKQFNSTGVNQLKCGPSPPLLGMSHRLAAGACGIAPDVFLQRCLEESRCALFL